MSVTNKVIYTKDYDGDELSDVSRDVLEAFDERFNPEASVIESDSHGLPKGKFKVTIEYISE